MNEPIFAVQKQLEKIQHLIPLGSNLKEYLKVLLDEQIEMRNKDLPMGISYFPLSSYIQLISSARMAVELVDMPEKLAAKPEGIVDLGVIEWLLRPSLAMQNGVFEKPSSGPWRDLDSHMVEMSSKSVCRIDIEIKGYHPIHLGTGFVVYKNGEENLIIMTNAHVIEEALRLGWATSSDLSLVGDFNRYSLDEERRIALFSVDYKIHPAYDLALLSIPIEKIEGDAIPLPLHISEKDPDSAEGMAVGVIGHPSFDSNKDPFPFLFGFGTEFGVKRFSPGYLRLLENRNWRGKDVEVFLHDATTLSGSSGSCILNLSNQELVGLHFGGWPMSPRYLEKYNIMAQLFFSNGAVPLWLLRNDPMTKSLF